jgi:hypothetical protein
LAKSARAVRWEELPLDAWDREIAARVAFRPASEAYSDALLPHLCSDIRANADGKIDHLFIDHLIQRITYDLRVCRDIYRKHLEAMQLESAKRCHFIAYEYAVARERPADSVEDYWSTSIVPPSLSIVCKCYLTPIGLSHPLNRQ